MPLHEATTDVEPQLKEWKGVKKDPASQERNHLLSDVKNDESKVM